ncbi:MULTISPECIES: hypothetical protein [unclassified Streptomyces]|uniref:hypothetical protein n=1 Tax=unclassified Streptomyces TaxID=2593676 RepID=UPI002E15E693|nr:MULTISPECIES: hypothetical protein [unclassified Streptomyces]WSR21703.1 hypothetical protein OG573_22910 [Streptomyces sp. NBC_01205]
MSAPPEPGGPPEPLWVLAANVVQWRRWGEDGQALRPGTKTFPGGAKVYVFDVVDGLDQCMVVGRPRHTRRHVQGYVHTRHLHAFRPKLVRSPAVLRAAGWSRFWGAAAEADAVRTAPGLELRAAQLRGGRWPDRPHPRPCLCHECLAPGGG